VDIGETSYSMVLADDLDNNGRLDLVRVGGGFEPRYQSMCGVGFVFSRGVGAPCCVLRPVRCVSTSAGLGGACVGGVHHERQHLRVRDAGAHAPS
jgi:hypothetical protein